LFRQLFQSYSKCHKLFNSAKHLSQADIDILQSNITDFLAVLRMVEDHVIDFLTQWKTGCGFYGEQGGESIHNVMNKKQMQYKYIKKELAF
jgi:hypothetical protein